MKYKILSTAFGVALFTLLWLFTGIERIGREHGATEFEFFAKQQPTWRLVYQNSALCGECDLTPLAQLNAEQRAQFSDYCAVRFGLTQISVCYAIFAEQQRLANRALQSSRK